MRVRSWHWGPKDLGSTFSRFSLFSTFSFCSRGDASTGRSVGIRRRGLNLSGRSRSPRGIPRIVFHPARPFLAAAQSNSFVFRKISIG